MNMQLHTQQNVLVINIKGACAAADVEEALNVMQSVLCYRKSVCICLYVKYLS